MPHLLGFPNTRIVNLHLSPLLLFHYLVCNKLIEHNAFVEKSSNKLERNDHFFLFYGAVMIIDSDNIDLEIKVF